MDITTLQEYVTMNADEEDGDVGLRLLVAKLGQLAEVSIGLDDGGLDDDDEDEAAEIEEGITADTDEKRMFY